MKEILYIANMVPSLWGRVIRQPMKFHLKESVVNLWFEWRAANIPGTSSGYFIQQFQYDCERKFMWRGGFFVRSRSVWSREWA